MRTFPLVDLLVHSLSTGAYDKRDKRRGARLVGALGVLLHGLDERLGGDGADDSVPQRIRNVAFVVVASLVLALSVVWGVVMLALGKLFCMGSLMLVALLALLALLLVVHRRLCTPQQGSLIIIAILVLLPATIHVVQGSLEHSAAVLVWSTTGAPLATVLLRSRVAVFVVVVLSFVSVALATLIAALTGDMWRELRERERFDGVVRLVLFALNASVPALVVLVGLLYSDLRLAAERRRFDALRECMLPPRIAALLKDGAPPQAIVERFENVTCFYSDIVGFPELSERHTPAAAVAMLDALFRGMDAAAIDCGVLKMATCGDAYFAVCGAPDAVDAREAATRIAVFALMVRNLVARETAQYGVQLRIGLHSGPVLAGVLGVPVPQFTLIGDAVKTVSRIESLGAPGKVLCSAATRALLRGRFRFSARSPLKGKRTTMQTFWLAGPLLTADPTSYRSSLSSSQGTGALDGNNDTQSMLQLVSRGAADVVPVPMSQNHRPGDREDGEC